MSLCKDCAHFCGTSADIECQAPQNAATEPDYVNGGERKTFNGCTAQHLRKMEHRCGPQAIWFIQVKVRAAA